jgi:hypothetical protein
MTKFYIFYGSKYQAESGGVFAALVDATAIRRASFEEVGERLASGPTSRNFTQKNTRSLRSVLRLSRARH